VSNGAESNGQTADGALVARVRQRLVDDAVAVTPVAVAAAVRAESALLGDHSALALVDRVDADLRGVGVLEPLLRDDDVTDVLVNAPDEVWVDRGSGLVRTAVRFADEDDVRRLAQRLAARCGRRLDAAVPWVDARLDDGTRVHAVLPPLTARGTTLSLRVPRRRAFTLEELVGAGSVPELGAQWLHALVQARLPLVLSGGTGTGKTTVLSTLLGCVDPAERIVIVEDSAELRPDHPHVVRLEARDANVEGRGAVDLATLVRQALRMRPDRLVVGEARGAEVVDLLGALNTGHDGGCATVHANTASAVPARLEALGMLAGLDRSALHAQLHAALSVVVHLTRDRTGLRRVAEVHVLDRSPDGIVRTVPALAFPAPSGPGPDQTSGARVVAGPGEPRLRRLVEGT
jgi:pilus assembly protein CpaF